MKEDDTRLVLTVPVLDCQKSSAPIHVPRCGIQVAQPVEGLFYGVHGGETKRPYISAVAYHAQALSRSAPHLPKKCEFLVDISLARPRDMHTPRDLSGRRLLHLRYLHAPDRRALGALWSNVASTFFRAKFRPLPPGPATVDEADAYELSLAYSLAMAALFDALPDLEILVLPMVTALMAEPTWVAVVRVANLVPLVQGVRCSYSSRTICLPGASVDDDDVCFHQMARNPEEAFA